jgi:hypothetical protein
MVIKTGDEKFFLGTWEIMKRVEWKIFYILELMKRSEEKCFAAIQDLQVACTEGIRPLLRDSE